MKYSNSLITLMLISSIIAHGYVFVKEKTNQTPEVVMQPSKLFKLLEDGSTNMGYQDLEEEDQEIEITQPLVKQTALTESAATLSDKQLRRDLGEPKICQLFPTRSSNIDQKILDLAAKNGFKVCYRTFEIQPSGRVFILKTEEEIINTCVMIFGEISVIFLYEGDLPEAVNHSFNESSFKVKGRPYSCTSYIDKAKSTIITGLSEVSTNTELVNALNSLLTDKYVWPPQPDYLEIFLKYQHIGYYYLKTKQTELGGLTAKEFVSVFREVLPNLIFCDKYYSFAKDDIMKKYITSLIDINYFSSVANCLEKTGYDDKDSMSALINNTFIIYSKDFEMSLENKLVWKLTLQQLRNYFDLVMRLNERIIHAKFYKALSEENNMAEEINREELAVMRMSILLSKFEWDIRKEIKRYKNLKKGDDLYCIQQLLLGLSYLVLKEDVSASQVLGDVMGDYSEGASQCPKLVYLDVLKCNTLYDKKPWEAFNCYRSILPTNIFNESITQYLPYIDSSTVPIATAIFKACPSCTLLKENLLFEGYVKHATADEKDNGTEQAKLIHLYLRDLVKYDKNPYLLFNRHMITYYNKLQVFPKKTDFDYSNDTFLLAMHKFYSNNFKGANLAIATANKEGMDSFTYHFHKGRILLRKGQEEAASQHFRGAIGADPNDIFSYYFLEKSLSGEISESDRALFKGLDIEKVKKLESIKGAEYDSYPSYFNDFMKMLYTQDNNVEIKALAYVVINKKKKALKLLKTTRDGVVIKRFKDYYLKKTVDKIKHITSDAVNNKNAKELKADLKMLDEAIDILGYYYMPAFLIRGKINYYLKRYEMAEEDLSRYVKMKEPEDDEALSYLGLIYYRGDRNIAISDRLTNVNIMNFYKGMACLRLGLRKRAEVYLSNLLPVLEKPILDKLMGNLNNHLRLY
jgi:hypothetical protein